MGLFSFLDSKKSSTTNTTTENNYADNRSVVDAGGGIVGSGNDVSTKWTQTTQDSNNQTWTQNSNTETNATNSGNTSTHNQWTAIDGGAVLAIRDMGLAQTEMAGKIAQIAADNAKDSNRTAAEAAIKTQERAARSMDLAMERSYDFATSSNAQAFKSGADAIGFAREGVADMTKLAGQLVVSAQRQADQAAGTARQAYDSAASQANGNKTLMLTALAVVGVVAATLIFKRA